MKAWLRSVYGAIFASLLTIALNGNVYAETEDPAFPDEAPTQIIEPEVPASSDGLSTPVTASEPAPAAPAAIAKADVSVPTAPPAAAEASISAAEPDQAAVPATEIETADDTQAIDTPVSDTGATEETEQKEVPAEAPETQAPADAASSEDTTPAEIPTEDDAAADDLYEKAVKEDLVEGAAEDEFSIEEAKLPDSSDESSIGEDTKDAELPALMAAATDETAAESLTVNGEEEAVTAAEPLRGDSSSDTTFTRTEDGIYIMVNHSGEEKLNAEGDITILAAGINKISSISGTGKVRIAGTGILLVDSLQGNLELLTLTDIYDEGSTAVFVRQAGTTSTYQLVNGTVPGILDEEYRIEGCTLVVPSGGNLLLCGTGAEPLSDGTVAYYHGTEHGYKAEDADNVMETSGKLTIAEKAALIIKKGASVILEDLWSLGGTFTEDFTRRPMIITESDGRLAVDGTVGSGGIIELGADSVLSGSGSITTYMLTVGDPSVLEGSGVSLSMQDLFLNGNGEIANMTIHDTAVHPESSSVKLTGLVTTGNSVIVLPYGSELNIAKVDGTLTLRQQISYDYFGGYSDSYSENSRCIVSGDLQGSGRISFESGIFELPSGTNLNKVTVSDDFAPIIYDYAGVLKTSLNPLRMQPENVPSRIEKDGIVYIPIVASHYHEEGLQYGFQIAVLQEFADFLKALRVQKAEMQSPFSTFVDLGPLQQAIEDYRDHFICEHTDCFPTVELLYRDKNGKLYTRFFSEVGGDLSADDLYLIRVIWANPSSYVAPDSPSVLTGIHYTGSGILGGDGAGSVNLGNPISIPTDNDDAPSDDNHNDDNSNVDINSADDNKLQENKEDPDTAVVQATAKLQVWATQETGAYTLHAKIGDRIVTGLDGYIDVFLDYTPAPQTAGKSVYVVFRDADGKLVAFRATYGELSGKLHFRTNQLGKFVILTFDFDGEEFSDAFYRALEACAEIAALN
jgi:hypothetical protein